MRSVFAAVHWLTGHYCTSRILCLVLFMLHFGRHIIGRTGCFGALSLSLPLMEIRKRAAAAAAASATTVV